MCGDERIGAVWDAFFSFFNALARFRAYSSAATNYRSSFPAKSPPPLQTARSTSDSPGSPVFRWA